MASRGNYFFPDGYRAPQRQRRRGDRPNSALSSRPRPPRLHRLAGDVVERAARPRWSAEAERSAGPRPLGLYSGVDERPAVYSRPSAAAPSPPGPTAEMALSILVDCFGH